MSRMFPSAIFGFFLMCSLASIVRRSEAICGKPYYQPNLSSGKESSNRVVRGYNARPHSHPWQALLFVNMDGDEFNCGGTLIHYTENNSSDLVLTAAHCVVDVIQLAKSFSTLKDMSYRWNRLFKRNVSIDVPIVSPKGVEVYLGIHNPREEEPSRTMRAVTDIMVKKFHQFSQEDDIAILKLDRKVEYNNYIQGICLPLANEKLPPHESRCFVTGWGDLGTGTNPDELQQVEVFPYHGYVLSRHYKKEKMLCSRRNDTEGPAQGDSGGPLACTKGNNKFVLYGITSFGVNVDFICHRGKYTMFTKVSRYLNWLKKVAQPRSQQV